MKLNLTLITKFSVLFVLGAALSGCGIQEEMQKGKIQDDLQEAAHQASLGNLAQTKVWVDRAITADPERVETYVYTKPEEDQTYITAVDVFASVNDYKDVEAYMQKAAVKFPNDYHVQVALMNAQEILGETAAMQQTANHLTTILEARVAKGNVDGDVLASLSSAYWQLGNRPKALATSQKAISIYVTDWRLYNIIAYSIADVNSKPDLAQALNNAKVALAGAQKQGGDNVDSHVAAIRDTIGWVEYRQGNYKQAGADINLALEASPREPEIRYHLAMVYLAEGDKAAAKSELTKALLVYPDYADAKAAMAQVKDAPPMPPVAMTGMPDPSAPGTSTLPGG